MLALVRAVRQAVADGIAPHVIENKLVPLALRSTLGDVEAGYRAARAEMFERAACFHRPRGGRGREPKFDAVEALKSILEDCRPPSRYSKTAIQQYLVECFGLSQSHARRYRREVLPDGLAPLVAADG